MGTSVRTAAAEHLPDGVLFGRLCEGDCEAFEELVRRYWYPLARYARSVTGDRFSAEDVVQETFAYLWRTRPNLSPFGSVRALLYRTARHIALNESRRARVRRRHARGMGRLLGEPRGDTDIEAALEMAARAELRRLLEKHIGALPFRRRQVFLLGYVHGVPQGEIAEVLGISLQTVRNQMSAALKELRHRLRTYAE